MKINHLLIPLFAVSAPVYAFPTWTINASRNVSQSVFDSLEELARIVDISYCVGSTGIKRPFQCLSRCSDFEGFELVTTWNTGPLLSDSCGYVAVSHPPHAKRVIVAFRGTYSIANTIADLSTNPAEYAPFPSEGDNESICATAEKDDDQSSILPQMLKQELKRSSTVPECPNCTVHAGFMTSWRNTRCTIVPHVEEALHMYADYELTLVGHSLGGAVATLAALEFQARGWEPHVTTFGEPRIGNKALNEFIDKRFHVDGQDHNSALMRRVTHSGDPVPLLPLEEWGYRMHTGEIFISKSGLPPSIEDLVNCDGPKDPACIANGAEIESLPSEIQNDIESLDHLLRGRDVWKVPDRYRLWDLFLAHRDYFWRLGLCIPGGDPWNWSRNKYSTIEMSDEE